MTGIHESCEGTPQYSTKVAVEKLRDKSGRNIAYVPSSADNAIWTKHTKSSGDAIERITAILL